MATVDDWVAELRLACSPRTVDAYRRAVTDLTAYAGAPNPDVLTRRDVLMWLGRESISSNSRAVYLRRIAAWARWAQRPDLVDGVRVAPYRDPAVRLLTDAEVAAMVAACRGEDDRALLLLLAGLGLRRSEAAAVRGTDVSDMHLTVRGKGGRVDRLPVDTAIRQTAGRMPTGWWFPDSAGGHVSHHTIARRVARIGRDAGAGHVTPHMLRRWYATSLSRHGAPLASISALLRHRSITTTMIYVRPDDADLREARSRLPALAA